MIRLERWSTTTYPGSSPYDPPECTLSFHGLAYGHPRFAEGQEITTSPIRLVVTQGLFGTVVRTGSGSEYTLGEPDPAFVRKCREKGWHVPTRQQPLKVRADAA